MTLSTRDKVRLRIGDTDPDAPILNDEEVDDLLAEASDDIWYAAALACEAIAAQYASRMDFSTDNQSFSPSTVVAHYRELAAEFRAIGETAGNVSTTRIDGYSQDVDNRETTGVSSGGRISYGLYGHPDRVP